MTVTVRYYAQLHHDAGVAHETVETSAATVAELWTHLAGLHTFSLPFEQIRAAQNDEFCEPGDALIPGALVVYMPPVAGG